LLLCALTLAVTTQACVPLFIVTVVPAKEQPPETL
jgi:hypothetical protein